MNIVKPLRSAASGWSALALIMIFMGSPHWSLPLFQSLQKRFLPSQPAVTSTRQLVSVMSFAAVQVETRLACKDGLLRLGSKEAQLASRSFWGKEMLHQRLCDLEEQSKRQTVPTSSCFPTLRRRPQSTTDSSKERQHAQATSDCNGDSSASDGSVNNSPLLAQRQARLRRSKTSLGTRTYRPAPANEPIFRSNSDELLPRPPSHPPPMRIGSKEAKLASASFWGPEMLQKRLVDLAAEKPSDKSDSKLFVSLPPLMDHYHRPIARPRTGFGFYNSWDGVSSRDWWTYILHLHQSSSFPGHHCKMLNVSSETCHFHLHFTATCTVCMCVYTTFIENTATLNLLHVLMYNIIIHSF